MEIKLTKKPKNPVIVEGFPGFGLVGTIATEFLLDHLDVEMIGKITLDNMPAIVAIHESKLVEPLGVFYNEEYNLVIIHAISASTGKEWEISEGIQKMANEMEAKEIISLEGVGSGQPVENPRVFFYSSDNERATKLKNSGLDPLKEGIIMGVTSSVMLRMENFPVSCLFAETESNLPDSKAAAKVIEALDKYLDLKVDTKPLLEQATKFEEKLKGILSKSKTAEEMNEKKKLSYVG